MSNEARKDFNAMLNARRDMPKIQIITDPKAIAAYGGNRMYFAPPIDYDRAMRRVPFGKLLTVGDIRSYSRPAERRRLYRTLDGRAFCVHRRLGQPSAHRRQDPLLADAENRRRAE